MRRTWRVSAACAAFVCLLAAAVSAAAMEGARSGSQDPVPAGGPVPAGFRPQSATFVSAQLGWVLGTASCRRPPCTSVLRTEDGGVHWVGIPAPRAPLARSDGPGTAPSGVTTLRFADARDGFATGEHLWSTHDGGRVWRRLVAPRHIAWLAAAGGLVYALTYDDGLWSSPSGADRWRRIRRVAGTEVVASRSGYTVLTELRSGFAVSEANSRHATPCRRQYDFAADLVALTGRNLVLVCADQPAGGTDMRAAWRSSDGGKQWTPVGRPLRNDDFDGVAAAGRTVVEASASGDTNLFASFAGGPFRQVLALDDGGEGFSDLGLTTARQGFAVERDQSMWMTYDGGHRWTPVRFRRP